MEYRYLRLATFLLAGSTLLLMSAPLSAQISPGQTMPDGRNATGANASQATVLIRGQVLDQQGIPMAQVLVQLYAVDGPLMAETTTNPMGSFSVRLASMGPYEVRLTFRGVVTYTSLTGGGEVLLRFNPPPDAIQLMAGGNDSTVAVNDLEAGQKAKDHMVSALHALQKHDYDKAYQIAEEVIVINPNWNRGYQLRGVLEMVKGDYSSAINDLKKAIELNAKNNGALTALGKSYTATGKYDLANDNLKQALAMAPVMWPTYIEMASLDLHRGNYSEAEEMAKHAQFTTPAGPAEAHFLQAVAAERQGLLEVAAVEYTNYLGVAVSTPSNVHSIIYARQHLALLPRATPEATPANGPAGGAPLTMPIGAGRGGDSGGGGMRP